MIFNLLNDPPLLIIVPLAIIMVIAVHEYSHALVGFWLGDHTAEAEGRLTLNPLAHLDPVGTILLLIAGFGWGKPVPFNPYNLKWPKWGPAVIALAGPLSNFVSLVFFILVLKLLSPFISPDSYLVIFLFYLISFNLILGIFNLLPVPPLDGSKLLVALLPPRFDGFSIWLQRSGPLLLIGLVILLNTVGGN